MVNDSGGQSSIGGVQAMRGGSYSFIASLAGGLLGSFALLTGAGAATAQNASAQASVTYPSAAAVSPPLSSLPPAPWARAPQDLKLAPAPRRLPPVPAGRSTATSPGSAAQIKAGQSPKIKGAFFGIGENGYIPPDSNIAVGQSYIVQVVNSEVAVFNKSDGTFANGPNSLSSIWQSLKGNPCSRSNSGDAIVQYDRLADNGNGRWFISELGNTSGKYSECIAVSTTSDPAGTYYLYSYDFGNVLNDYPKFGVWPAKGNSAYLATYNLFQSGSAFIGGDLCAYDRDAMLAGAASPAQICQPVANGGFLPSDLDGSNPPPDNSPGYFVAFDSNSSLQLYSATPDFSTGAMNLSSPSQISVDKFTEACGGGTCIPQKGTSQQLDSLARIIHRGVVRRRDGGGWGAGFRGVGDASTGV